MQTLFGRIGEWDGYPVPTSDGTNKCNWATESLGGGGGREGCPHPGSLEGIVLDSPEAKVSLCWNTLCFLQWPGSMSKAPFNFFRKQTMKRMSYR